MSTLIHDRVEQCRNGTNPTAICKVSSGWVVLGDVQFLEGYSLLLPDPVVSDLNTLDVPGRERYLSDMAFVGDALLSVTNSYRVNYETLGNTEAALHTHIFPRFMSEDPELRLGPAWFYDWSAAPVFEINRHRAIMDQIRSYLEQKGVVV
jgi:diadenosine tetraphosphate (Ap4A) HIT family hydrolase